MKKSFLLIIALISVMVLGMFSGCGNQSGKCIVHDFGENHLCKENVCSVCGKVKGASAMHNFNSWEHVLEASCLSAGLKTRTCKDCGYIESASVEKLTTHVYENGVCKICNAVVGTVVDGETSDDGIFTDSDMFNFVLENQKFGITNGQVEVKPDAGYTSALDAVELTLSEDKVTVWYFNEAYKDMSIGSLMSVNFRMLIKGTSGKYSQNVKLINTQGITVDYGYPEEVWNRVTVDAQIAQMNGKKGARFTIEGTADQTITLSDFTTDNDVMVLENLFGGVKVIQWQYPKALMQCYIIVSPDGTVMMMDGGADGGADIVEKAKESLYNYLVSNNMTNVDHWFITHYHGDHTGSLAKILSDSSKELTIENIYYDFPSLEHIAKYEGTASTEAILNGITNGTNPDGSKKVKNVITPHKTDNFVLDEYMNVKILNDAYFYSHNNMGNDSSIVFKLETPGASIAFLGDMSYFYGDTLIKDQYFYDEISTCEVIQMGHHGQGGCSEYFYKQCKAMKICLYPSASWVFDARNSEADAFGSNGLATMPTRNWVREIGIKYSFGGDQTLVIGK